jgi:hypothetical protein
MFNLAFLTDLTEREACLSPSLSSWCYAGLDPEDETRRQRRPEEVRRDLARRYAGYADTYRDALVKFYGEERGRKIRYAQAFEVCEYGRQPSRDELKEMFPF